MGRSEMAAYESAVDKLCGKWVVDATKELKHCIETIEKLSRTLAKQISSIQVPQDLDEKELKGIPDRINKILKDDSDHIRDVVELDLIVEVDVKKKKVHVNGWGYGGKLLGLR